MKREELLLFTANRNDDGPLSLEATLRNHGSADDLPVVTVANIHHFRFEPSYIVRDGERFLDICLEIEKYRGAGRLYVP